MAAETSYQSVFFLAMTPLLLAAAWLPQKPVDPHVVLPAGWKVEFSDVWGWIGVLIDPSGGKVAFPGYGGTFREDLLYLRADPKIVEGLNGLAKLGGGAVPRLSATDPQGMSFSIWLAGRPFEAFLGRSGGFAGRNVTYRGRSGALAFSIGKRWPAQHPSDDPLEFVALADSAPRALVVSTIVLSRLAAPQRNANAGGPARVADRPKPPGPTKPLLGYTYQAARRRFESPSGPPIEREAVVPLYAVANPGRAPDARGWLGSVTLPEGTWLAKVDRGVEVQFWPRVVKPNGPLFVVYRTRPETPQAAFATLFLALAKKTAR